MRPQLRQLRLGERLQAPLTPLQVLGCAALLFLADWGYQRAGYAFFPAGPLDESAHVLTALLLLQGLSPRLRRRLGVPALIGSVAIDLDHVPQYLGNYFLTEGTPRPHTHSLLTIVVLLALALAVRRWRWLFLGLALGVALHFFRDLAEGGGSGVPLLWPFSYHSYSYPHSTYLVLMAGVVAAELTAGLLSPRLRAQQRARRRRASRASV